MHPALPARDARADAAQQPVVQAVNEAVHLDTLAAMPGSAHDGRVADVDDLLDDVQLARAARRAALVVGASESLAVLARISWIWRSQLSARPIERFVSAACTPPQP